MPTQDYAQKCKAFLWRSSTSMFLFIDIGFKLRFDFGNEQKVYTTDYQEESWERRGTRGELGEQEGGWTAEPFVGLVSYPS